MNATKKIKLSKRERFEMAISSWLINPLTRDMRAARNERLLLKRPFDPVFAAVFRADRLERKRAAWLRRQPKAAQ